MDSDSFSAILNDQTLLDDSLGDTNSLDSEGFLSENYEIELYNNLERNLLEYIKTLSPLGFFQTEYIRTLNHILGDRDSVKRIFFLTKEAEEDFRFYLPVFLGRLRLLKEMITYTWERIYNDPVLCKLFFMNSMDLPIIWKDNKYQIISKNLESDQINLLQKYCDLNYSFYLMVVRVPLDSIYLRNLVERSIRRLEKLKFLYEDSLKHSEAVDFYPSSQFHKDKLFVLRTQLQMMNVSFRIFPVEVERFLIDIKKIRSNITSLISELFQGSFPLVQMWSKKYCNKLQYSSLDYNDLCQEGRLGLMKALYRFDYRRGNRFSTYASYWIKHYMRLFITSNLGPMSIPIHQIQYVNLLKKFKLDFFKNYNKMPTDEEICNELKWDSEFLYYVNNSSPTKVSFDSPIESSKSDSNNNNSVGDYIPDDSMDPGQMLDNENLRVIISNSIKELNPKFSNVLFDYLGLTPEGVIVPSKTMTEISEIQGISRQGISQRVKKGQELIRPLLLKAFKEYYS